MASPQNEKANTQEKKHWANIEEAGVYWCMKFMLMVHSVLGKFIFLLILYPVVSYYFFMNKLARGASLDYLHQVARFTGKNPASVSYWQSYQHFIQFAQSMVDKVSAWNNKIKFEDVVIQGREEFYQAAKKNHGAILLGSHLGNVEICRALVTLNHNTKLTILVHTKHAQNFNRILSEANPNHTTELIQVTDMGPDIAILLEQRIAAGEFIYIVGDRVPVKNNGRTSMAEFLGKPAQFAQGPFILAALLKCPVYTLFCVKESGAYHLYFEHFADRITMPRKTRSEALQAYVQTFATRLEHHCLKAPKQWFNFYYYWDTPQTTSAEKPSSKID
ncbi:Lipid A biosynthesis lauroyltransferase [BD1-7 clade bacterium]|uniref:Lipid A biosynthesis lauroyltransferase n=1 Tax=BD1-7 clade bacterium TaxID=2029982 RepID=A0A5S9PVR6_9GAMM|nr:Lipid A biosynthesis lauroyltransferase [BD1-7 clade bacterium]